MKGIKLNFSEIDLQNMEKLLQEEFSINSVISYLNDNYGFDIGEDEVKNNFNTELGNVISENPFYIRAQNDEKWYEIPPGDDRLRLISGGAGGVNYDMVYTQSNIAVQSQAVAHTAIAVEVVAAAAVAVIAAVTGVLV